MSTSVKPPPAAGGAGAAPVGAAAADEVAELAALDEADSCRMSMPAGAAIVRAGAATKSHLRVERTLGIVAELSFCAENNSVAKIDGQQSLALNSNNYKFP